MKKLSEFFKKLWSKFKSFGKAIKIAIVASIIAILIAIISTVVILNTKDYETLFNDLDSADAQTVINQLETQGIAYKVDGNKILVESKYVDKQRLELSGQLSSASKGYELMDDTSSFGMTDEEFEIYKIRMTQGEIEKSIKTISNIQDANVLITPAKDSVFTDSATEGSASIVIKLKPGVTLSKDNIKAIISLVSMGTENIPEKNIAVIDTDGNLLSKDLSDSSSSDGTVSSETIQSQYSQEKQYEDTISQKVKQLLEPVVGEDNVQAQVNVDLDFDSKKITEYDIDPNDVLISQETENTYNQNNGDDSTSESPVDNNMSNTIDDKKNTDTSSKTEHQINNYDHSNKKTETVKAPGEVRRMTVSVFVNGKLDEATKTAFEDAIKSATGYDEARQDTISVVGVDFDTSKSEQIKASINAYNEKIAEAKKKKMIIAGVIAGILLTAIIVTLVIIRRKKHKEEEESLLDVVVGDDTQTQDPVTYAPIDLGPDEDEKTHMENEIKKYATEKPEQVAEIIKSWLSDNER